MSTENKHPLVAVVGAGTMGLQISLLLAAKKINVVLVDVSRQKLDQALLRMRNDVRLINMMATENDRITDACIENIALTTDINDVTACSILIENISEDVSLKKKLYARLAEVIQPHTIIAVNTSCIPVNSIAEMLPDPSRVIGCHFMNPVYFKKLVEVVRTPFNTMTELTTLTDFLKSIGKSSVIVQDSPGFVANRISHLMMNEAAAIIQEKLCSPKELDLIFKLGYGHAMGPLETADLIGIDTVVNSLRVLEDNLDRKKFLCCSLLTDMVEQGKLGRKSGEGFYSY
ncbi:MAG: 3-hydroxyacyl-CoA dehydrogenase family protein [Chitinophagaceae bacterium]